MITKVQEVKTNKINKPRFQDQSKLEDFIVKYQQAIERDNKTAIHDAYKEITDIYPAISFLNVWHKKYHYLYDTQEDFISDYLRMFCTALVSWQPRHLRKESRYKGKGDFKNYFWSTLQHNYINMVKSEASGKRNISTRCPICEEWCMTLSTHIINNHTELLWEYLENAGYKVDKLTNCPFCQSYKPLRKLKENDTQTERLKRHIVSMHSNYLFEEFKDKYPEYSTTSSKAASINVVNEQDETDMYEKTASVPSIDDLLACGLSDIQKKMISKVFNGSVKSLFIKYDRQLYNCTQEEFNYELQDLQDKMIISGLAPKLLSSRKESA